jgi:phosphohistidine phosphatase
MARPGEALGTVEPWSERLAPMASSSARRLILLRHAKSAWPDDVADHERPLAARGRRDAPAAGKWLRQSDYVPDQVLCSTARRARETWQLAEEKLGAHPQTAFEDRVYGASSTDLLALARQTSADVHTLLIVGHDPAMRELTLELADPHPEGAGAETLGQVRAKYPTAAIAVLLFSGGWAELGPGQARLADFVVPDEFHAGHGRRR